jgi:hypothetical protein
MSTAEIVSALLPWDVTVEVAGVAYTVRQPSVGEVLLMEDQQSSSVPNLQKVLGGLLTGPDGKPPTFTDWTVDDLLAVLGFILTALTDRAKKNARRLRDSLQAALTDLFVAGAIVGPTCCSTRAASPAASPAPSPRRRPAGRGSPGPILAALNAIEEAGQRVADVAARHREGDRQRVRQHGGGRREGGGERRLPEHRGPGRQGRRLERRGAGEAMKFLNRNTAEALEGSEEAVAAFEKVGISVDDLRGAKPEDVFFKFGGLRPDRQPAEKTRIAMQLLGRGGTESIAFLNLGPERMREFAAELQRLGGGVSESQAKIGDEFGRMEIRVEAALHGIKAAVAEPILQFLADNAQQVGPILQQRGGHGPGGHQRGHLRAQDAHARCEGVRGAVGPELLGLAKDTWGEFKSSLPDIIELVRALLALTREFVSELHSVEQAAKLLADNNGLGFLQRHPGLFGAAERSADPLGLVAGLGRRADRGDAEARGVDGREGVVEQWPKTSPHSSAAPTPPPASRWRASASGTAPRSRRGAARPASG